MAAGDRVVDMVAVDTPGPSFADTGSVDTDKVRSAADMAVAGKPGPSFGLELVRLSDCNHTHRKNGHQERSAVHTVDTACQKPAWERRHAYHAHIEYKKHCWPQRQPDRQDRSVLTVQIEERQSHNLGKISDL